MSLAATSPAVLPVMDRAAAIAQLARAAGFRPVPHVGGFVRTCEWLQVIAEGRFILDDADGFRV
jgi:hypothetical protein